METAKSTQWAFTAYKDQWDLFNMMPEIVAEWGWQQEICPKTQREHYQGYLRTKRQVRFSQIRKILPGVHLEVAKNWQALVNYCKKTETAVDGTGVNEVSRTASLTMAKALIRVASVRPERDYSHLNTDEELRRAYTKEYDYCVGLLLREDENLIGLYSQPQYERSYIKWRFVWVDKADSEKTDRQTDTRSEIESVVSGTDSWEGAFDRS